MTVDAVTQVIDKIKGDRLERICSNGFGLSIPQPLVDEIFRRRYSTDCEKSRAIASTYVNIHPDASWQELTSGLYWTTEFAVARESKSFMSTGMSCHYITY